MGKIHLPFLTFKTFTEGKKPYHELKFVRYGNLNPVKQLGYGKGTFHSPPAKKGIFAFPWPYIERFLLTVADMATSELHPKFQYVKDKAGKKISNITHPELYNQYMDRNYYDYSKSHDIALKRADNGDWSKDTIDSTDWDKHEHFVVELKKPKIFTYDGPIWHHLDVVGGIKHNDWTMSDFGTYKKALRKEVAKVKHGNFTKDHLEVFIERL